MNPTIPSVTNYMQQNPIMPVIPQFSFGFGQGAWEKPFTPDATLISTLLSKLRTGEVNFGQAAGQIIGSGGSRVSAGADPETVKRSLLASFGTDPFIGPSGQTGIFNQRNYGFMPQTTKNVVSKVTGMGATTQINALKGGLPTIPKL